MPKALPITVAIAAILPQEIALAMVKSTDGPGAKMIRIVAIRNSQNLLGIASDMNTP
jgi:hypothetical protein